MESFYFELNNFSAEMHPFVQQKCLHKMKKVLEADNFVCWITESCHLARQSQKTFSEMLQ